MKEQKYSLIKIALDDESALGSSHLLGCPDVPSKWNDEAIFYNDELFLAQINLSEFTIDGLPSSGILYFFLACGSTPYRGIVRYTPLVDTIERVEFNDCLDLDFNLNQEYQIVATDIDDSISLFKDKINGYKLKKDEVVLLSIDFTNYLDIDLLKNYQNKVAYIIKKEDLKNLDFSKAHLSVMLDD